VVESTATLAIIDTNPVPRLAATLHSDSIVVAKHMPAFTSRQSDRRGFIV